MVPKQIVHSDPEIVSGTPVFVGTRVPAQALLDYLDGGQTIEDSSTTFRACAASRQSPFSKSCAAPGSLRVMVGNLFCSRNRLKETLEIVIREVNE